MNLKELYWTYSEKTNSITANTGKGVYEIIEISPQNYNISIAKGSEYQELSGSESDIKKAIKICEEDFYRQLNNTNHREKTIEI